ncbi:radical SAM protein [bacterium]|nr:MAG: radical SAM protein [bacterium]
MKKISTKRIKITCDCNQDCIFCDSNISPDPDLYSEKQVKLQISQRNGLRRLNITGGEPTVCEKLEEYIELAKKTGYRDIAMLTNGNKFADKKYALQIKKSGLMEAIISVYHYDPQICDQISKVKGSFSQKLKGIANLQKLGIKITVNIVIFSGNYLAIPQIVDYLHKTFGIKYFAFSFLESNCEKVSRNPEFVPSLKVSMSYLKKAIRYCEKNKLQYLIPWNGAIPPCIFKVNKLKIIKPEKIIGTDFDSSRSYYPICGKCGERSYCLGILKEYAPDCIDIIQGENKIKWTRNAKKDK